MRQYCFIFPGELGMKTLRYLDLGSSPPARGTQEQAADDGRDGRFIPACAGNTILTGTFALPVTVHPRLRG